MYRVLGRHHDKLLPILDEERTLLEAGSAGEIARLGRLRWELARSLRAYQLFKHVELFDRAISCGSPEDAALARGMKARCIALGEEFTDHVRHWSSTSIIGAWAAYHRAALEMNARLRAHLVREREEAGRLCASAASPIRRAASLG